jgi:succinate dehydrogenase/fumarate reductase flavoprotein subunit
MIQRYTGTWDHESDIIVVGFGGAGGCAAIEAHDNGAGVILLEKQRQDHHYSNTRMSGGGYHSPDPSGDREALKAYAKAMFSGENLPWKFEGEQPEYSDGLAELWAEYAPQNTAFMCGLDPDYMSAASGEAAYPDFPGAKESGYRLGGSNYNREVEKSANCSSPHVPKDKKEAGEAFHACVLHGIATRAIPVHYETRALKLLHNEEGVIIGVKAERDGKELYYRAKKAVILTSGGFEYNKALRSAFLEGYGADGWAFYGSVANTGDGIIMGMESGAALSKVGSAAARLISSFPDLRSNGVRIGVAITAIGRKGAIVLDNFGARFHNERDNSKNPARYISYKYALGFDVKRAVYPRIPSWFVFDETVRARKSVTTTNITEYHDVPWSEDNHEAIDRGWILKGDTLEELAEKIKNHPDNHHQMDVEAFCRSVARFNEFCALGEDKDFNREADTLGPVKEPPFYAIALFPGGPNTKGGLKANEKRQVVDWNGRVIPRLYAAGEIASVFKYVYQAGGNVGECIVFGRVAGLNAAKEIPLN